MRRKGMHNTDVTGRIGRTGRDRRGRTDYFYSFKI